MHLDYFGVVDRVFGEHAQLASIRLLARLAEGSRRDTEFLPSDLGDTRCVFLPGGADQLGLVVGTAVRFNADENPRDRLPGQDLYRVSPSGVGWCMKRDTNAIRVLSEVHTDGDRLHSTAQLPEGTHLYIRRPPGLHGPWRVDNDGRHLLPLRGLAYKGKRVFDFDGDSWDPATYVEDWKPSILVEAYLLAPIDPHKGKPVDLATGRQIAKWFFELCEGDTQLSGVLKQLDDQFPGWRSWLREGLEDREDEIDRTIYQARLDRLERIVETLELGASSLKKLTRSRAFDYLWKRAVAECRSELEKEARGAWEPEQAVLEKERQALTKQVDDLRREQQRLLAEHEKRERVSQELSRHIAENRERLVRDIAVFRQTIAGPENQVRSLHSRRPVVGLEQLIAMRSSSLPATEDVSLADFARGSLADALASLGLSHHDSIRLHAAMLSCRAVLLPGAIWARAYAVALGPAANLLLLQVEPHWLTFREAWECGLDAVWQAASADSETLFLLHVQDIDRAVPEMWLRPVLDMLVGLRDTLPTGESWPPNLRLTASLASDEARLPIALSTVAHFAAPLPIETGREETPEEPSTASPAGVNPSSWATWLAGLPPPIVLENLARHLVKVPPVARKIVREEVSRLATILDLLIEDRTPEELLDKASEIRISHPKSYVYDAHDEL